MGIVHCSPVLGVSDKWQYSLDITPTDHDQVNKLTHDQGTKVLFVEKGDRFPKHPAK